MSGAAQGGRAAFILLAHEDLALAGRLARALSAGGRTVLAHIDARAGPALPFTEAAGPGVRLLTRRRAEWGMFGLVEAALDGLRTLLDEGGDWSHACLLSGADLPLRPLTELDATLGAAGETDFIEAERLQAPRAGDGERFRFWHPLPWRRRRGLFEALNRLQRRLGVSRRRPDGLDIALGSQWWTLSRGTAARILADPDLPRLIRFFRWSWIPDESFFQSLALRHAGRRAGLSLTLSRFDEAGLPYVFHDDHAALLDEADHFFARKVHKEAEGLRARLLARAEGPLRRAGFEGRAPEAAFRAARESRLRGREAVISPARLRNVWPGEMRGSAWPYLVIGGLGPAAAARLSPLLTGGGLRCHGRLFGPEGPVFAAGAPVAPGGVPASRDVRDLWPDQFVINLARGAAAAGEAMAFFLPVEDRHAIGAMVAADAGARILWWRGGWALEPGAEGAEAPAAAERAFLAMIRRGGAALEEAPAALLREDEAAALALIRRAAAR